MSLLSNQPDGLGYYYGFVKGDSRQINVRDEGPRYGPPRWTAYAGGVVVATGLSSKTQAEVFAIDWIHNNPRKD